MALDGAVLRAFPIGLRNRVIIHALAHGMAGSVPKGTTWEPATNFRITLTFVMHVFEVALPKLSASLVAVIARHGETFTIGGRHTIGMIVPQGLEAPGERHEISECQGMNGLACDSWE